MDNLIEKYIDLGWSIIPVGKDKIPAIPWKQHQTAKSSIQTVKAWMRQGHGLGLVTGKISGVVVVDDDRKKHNLNEWGFTSPLEVTTRSGGKHYYFKYQEGLGNTTNESIYVDVRGDGGYVVLPPTAGYEWAEFIDFADLPELTPEMIDLLYRDNKKGERVELSEGVGITEGGRDDGLLRLANSLCNNYPPSEWESAVLPIMVGINNTYSPPLDDASVLRIFDQATRFVKTNPKTTDAANAPLTIGQISSERINEREMEKDAPSTGYDQLDKLIKGFVPGHVYTTTGHTNVGKTAVCANFAYNVAQQGKRVLYIALEPDRSIVDYLATIHRKKLFDDLTNEDLQQDFGGIYFYGKEHIRTLESLTKTLEESERYDLVIVDHVGYFISGGNNTTQAQADAMKTIAGLAKQQKCAIILIQHPRKSTSTNRDEPMSEFQISGSAAFIQDATDVLILERNAKQDTETGAFEYTGSGWIKVAKAKSGRNGICKISFHEGKALITERGDYEF